MTLLDTLCATALTSLPTLGQLELAARALLDGKGVLNRASEVAGRMGDSLADRTVVLTLGHFRLVLGALYLDRRNEDGTPGFQPHTGRGPAGIVDIRASLYDTRVEAANRIERSKKRPNKKKLQREEVYSNSGQGATDTEALADFARNADTWWRNPHSPVHAALAA